MNDDVLIVGSLKDEELRKSINGLVEYVDMRTSDMASSFVVSMDMMKGAMKDFAINQKVSVDLMKQAWREMSSSFDAMVTAQGSATGGGSGSGKPTYPDNTIGALEKEISLLEKERKEMQLNSQELEKQNRIIEANKNILASQKGRNTFAEETKQATKDLGEAMSKSSATLSLAKEKLNALRNVQQQYTGSIALSVKQQNRLEDAIVRTEQKIRKLKAAMMSGSSSGSGQPMSFLDVKNMMPEESIDDITKKMKALRAVRAQDALEARDVANEYQKLKRKQAELLGMNIQHTKSNNYLAQSFGYIRNRIVYALTLGAITSFTKQIYEIRGQYELLERSLGVLVNSFERGSQVFQELNQMAIESPFTLMELAGAAKQLTAYNFAAKEVVDTTRRLADISAALGVPMERLTYNLGQIRAQTVLTARDARDFANAGLPIVASLAEHFTELEGKIVTTGDVYDRMSKKMVSYADVMAVLNKMTDEGGKFFEFQAKQAETLRVQMANLTLAWNNMLNGIGETHQGLLTLPISGLKALLQNWQAIDRVIKSLLFTFGVWKALQMITVAQQWKWAAATGATAKQMNILGAATKKVALATKALFMNPWTWVFVGIQALVDLGHQAWNASSAISELNEEIKKNADEASNSMLDYLNNRGNQSTRELARENKLTAEQGEKAWASIKEQIEQSALSANSLIAELQAIPDINERVATSFDYADKIQKAQAALQDLKDDSIDISSSYKLIGIGVDGLVDDLIDFADAYDKVNKDITFWDKLFGGDTKNSRFAELATASQEFHKELEITANSINNFITAYGITDPLQINEILERVRAQIKAKNPEIKGEAAKLFDIELDKKMAELTNGAVDRNTSLWKLFMDRLRHNSSAAFQDINDAWVKSDKELTPKQRQAIDDNLKYFQDSMPYAYDSVAKMVEDASKLRIQIGITFSTGNLTDFQNQVNERISAASGILDFGGSAYLPTANDNLSSWVKTQQQAIKTLKAENNQYAKDDTEWSRQKISANKREIQQRENLLDLFHQQHEEEKKQSGGRRKDADVVAEAIKQELQLIKEMQSNYEKLRKSGVSSLEAITLASSGYEATIMRINQVLARFGIDKFNAANFAGKDVRNLLRALEQQREALLNSGKVKTTSLQALDVEIQKLTIDAKSYDMTKITDGLNNELSKLKDEYELSMELSADSDLGDMFSEYFGIDRSSLPSSLEDAIRYAQELVDNAIQEAVKLDPRAVMEPFDLLRDDLQEWATAMGKDAGSKLVKGIENAQKYVNDLRAKDIRETSANWQKMLEKYAEYEYKRKKITEEYEKEIALARKKGASEDIIQAITNRRDSELAKLDFEEFQKSAYWVTATGDLANLSRDAIGMLIERLEAYKKSAKNLDPKQVKQLNKALSNLYKEQRKNNPFRAISDMMQQARERMMDYEQDIADVEAEITRLQDKRADGTITDKEEEALEKAIKKWYELKDAQKKAGEIDATQWVEAINATVAAVKTAVAVFDDLAKAIGGVKDSDVDKVFSVIEKGGQGAAMGAQIGGGWGALVGGVLGAASGLIEILANADNERINKEIEESERAVKRLELAYVDLQHAIDNAYGTGVVGAKRAMAAAKELELAELERQLRLEQSRKAKDRDDDKILDLQKQIKELRYEIRDSITEITNDLLGSDVSSFAENLVTSMIDAFKQGEDYMKVFEESFDKMIDNLIMKSIVSKIITEYLNNVWDTMDERIKQRTDADSEAWAKARQENDYWQNTTFEQWIKEIADDLPFDEWVDLAQGKGMDDYRRMYEERKKAAENAERNAREAYEAASQYTDDDIKTVINELAEMKPELAERLKELIGSWYTFGQSGNEELSALQQGIQGITEDTAGAIEAYLNIVSQRVFEHGNILMEIRDAVVGFDMDVQVATMSQILLQLQASYQAQMAIQNILAGWSNANGMAVRVEMV